MAGETAVETPAVVDNKVEEVVKTDKEAIVEEEAAAAKEEKKDEEKKEEKAEKPAPKEKVEKPKRFPVHKQDFEKDVVYLYQFNRTPVCPSTSPFCLKLESWLKLNNIKYENVDHKMKLRSKRGLLPFVELNGEEINDSNHIIEVLSKKFDKPMPLELAGDQKNIAHAMATMVENHLHWIITQWQSRDMENMLKGYKMDLSALLGSKLPAGLLNFYFKHAVLRKMAKRVKAQGLGAATNEEMDQMGKDDLKVLSDMLGEKQFLFGDEPSLLDIKVFSHLSPVVFVEKDYNCVLRDYLESDCKNLVGLVYRMKDRCWGDEHWNSATGEEMDLNPHIPKPVPAEPEKKEEEEKKEEKEKESEKEEEKKEDEKETADEKKEDKDKEEKEEEKK